MNKELLSKLADLAGDHARIVLIKMQMDLMPSWILIDEKGACEVVGTPWLNPEQKEAAARVMRKRMRKQKTVAYSLVVEAWAAQAPPGWKEGDPRTPNEKRPDRQEVVIAFATDGKRIEWRHWATRRDYLERVVALEPTPFDGAAASSWMTELLKSSVD
jgi:hypothetical protein